MTNPHHSPDEDLSTKGIIEDFYALGAIREAPNGAFVQALHKLSITKLRYMVTLALDICEANGDPTLRRFAIQRGFRDE